MVPFGIRDLYTNSKRYTTVKRYQKQYNDFSNQWFSNSKQLWTIQFLDYMSVGKFNMQNKFEVYLFYRFPLMWKRERRRMRVTDEVNVCGLKFKTFRAGSFDTLMNENENKTLLIVILFVFYYINSLPLPYSTPLISDVCASRLYHRSNKHVSGWFFYGKAFLPWGVIQMIRYSVFRVCGHNWKLSSHK